MSVNHISDGIIDEISTYRGTTFITVTYQEGVGNRKIEQTIRLVTGPCTIILNEKGRNASIEELRKGMSVDAAFSLAMTKSIPPQAEAYMIRITGNNRPEDVTSGTILSTEQTERSFTLISDKELSYVIRFRVPEHAHIWNRFGRPMEFSGLKPGMRVSVSHANYMTASIPPQTTAFEIRVI